MQRGIEPAAAQPEAVARRRHAWSSGEPQRAEHHRDCEAIPRPRPDSERIFPWPVVVASNLAARRSLPTGDARRAAQANLPGRPGRGRKVRPAGFLGQASANRARAPRRPDRRSRARGWLVGHCSGSPWRASPERARDHFRAALSVSGSNAAPIDRPLGVHSAPEPGRGGDRPLQLHGNRDGGNSAMPALRNRWTSSRNAAEVQRRGPPQLQGGRTCRRHRRRGFGLLFQPPAGRSTSASVAPLYNAHGAESDRTARPMSLLPGRRLLAQTPQQRPARGSKIFCKSSLVEHHQQAVEDRTVGVEQLVPRTPRTGLGEHALGVGHQLTAGER